jgi:hypothetical protein
MRIGVFIQLIINQIKLSYAIKNYPVARAVCNAI